MVTNLPVREFKVWENWKCASVQTLKVPKPEEIKWWGRMMSLRGDVDLGISEVTWLGDVTWDDMDTWDVCHMSVSFEHAYD
jgi:hypothetical protein